MHWADDIWIGVESKVEVWLWEKVGKAIQVEARASTQGVEMWKELNAFGHMEEMRWVPAEAC